ncbi:MAG: DNA polymerase III subunit beta [bacterium]
MKISCTQENLNLGLGIASHIAAKNSNLPILSNILVKVEDKIITLITTNLEIGLTVNIRGKVETDGEFAVEAKLISDFISLLPKERIDLEVVDGDLRIECQNQKTKVKGQLATEFPIIPKIDKKNPYIINAKEFKQGLSEVIFAASNSESRPEISGVFAKFSENELILAATDSYRLAEKKLKLAENNQQEEKKIIIPVRTLQEISRILGSFKDDVGFDDTENIEIYLSENQIMFSYGGVDLISRLIEGQYPDYTQIIPTTQKTKVEIDINNLVKAVKTASLFTKSGIYDIKLDFNSQKKEVVITSSSAQTGENTSNVEISLEGNDNIIVLNYRYLLDGLQNISSEKVIMELTEGNNPAVIKPKEKDDYVYIIMPIRQ